MSNEIVKSIKLFCGMPTDIALAVAYQKKKSYDAGIEAKTKEVLKRLDEMRKAETFFVARKGEEYSMLQELINDLS